MSPILGHMGRRKPGLWVVLAVGLPSPAWAAEPVNLTIGFDAGRLIVLSALAAGSVAANASLWPIFRSMARPVKS